MTAHYFFPGFLSAQNIVQVIEGKIIWKWSEGKQKFLPTGGKITVNVRRKSRGNLFWFEVRAWFELARVRIIRSQLYVQSNNRIKEIKS